MKVYEIEFDTFAGSIIMVVSASGASAAECVAKALAKANEDLGYYCITEVTL